VAIHSVYQILVPVFTKSLLLFALYISLFRLLLYYSFQFILLPVYLCLCVFFIMFFCTVILAELCAVLCAFVTFNNKVWLIDIYGSYGKIKTGASGRVNTWMSDCLLTAIHHLGMLPATRSTQPSILPGKVNRVPACELGSKQGAFTCVGQQVGLTLCDPIWQVTSCSFVVGIPLRAIRAFNLV